MKRIIFSCCLLIVTAFQFSSCDKEEEEDLTVSIVGEYFGTYGKTSGVGIENYTVIVSKVDENTIQIAPATGSEFEPWQSDVKKSSNSLIGVASDNETSLSFILGQVVVFSYARTVLGDFFQGERK